MDLVNKGRKIVMLSIVLLLFMDIIFTSISTILLVPKTNLNTISYVLVQSLVRLAVEASLSYFFYKGYKWANWLLLTLLLAVGILCLIVTFSNFNLLLLLFSIVFIGLAVLLFFSRTVKTFLDYQRN